jgi:hypothetical protein
VGLPLIRPDFRYRTPLTWSGGERVDQVKPNKIRELDKQKLAAGHAVAALYNKLHQRIDAHAQPGELLHRPRRPRRSQGALDGFDARQGQVLGSTYRVHRFDALTGVFAFC